MSLPPDEHPPGLVLDARLHLLDRQVLDVDGVPVCTVDDPFMRAAYDMALEGYASGGIPIGAVVVYRGEIIGRGHNSRVQRGTRSCTAR